MEFLNPFFAVVAALGFSMVFKVEKNQLIFVALLAFCGFFVKQVCLHFGLGAEISVLCGALIIGLLGRFIAEKKNILPHTLTLAAGIPMIPGSTVFSAIKYLIEFVSTKQADQQVLAQALYYGSKSIFILAALALGLTASAVVFKKKA